MSHAISCRMVCHNEAQLILKTRYLLEERIRQISGIQFLYRASLEQQQTQNLHEILLNLELHISLFSARIPKQTRQYYLVVSMIQEWMLR